MARLIDADATKLAICRDECGAAAAECSRMCCRFADVIDEMPTAFDVKLLMKKIATLDRIAKSDKQKALLGRVFFIIETMIEENEKEQNDDAHPCENCKTRKFFATRFDMHFYGEDCWYECEKYERWKEQHDDADTEDSEIPE